MDSAKEEPVYAVLITFSDRDHFTWKWTSFENGKDKGGLTLKLARVP